LTSKAGHDMTFKLKNKNKIKTIYMTFILKKSRKEVCPCT
jgi:hypothetical protein